MSIRVLDPNGRVMRPISPSNAKNWVEHSRAKWLHVHGFEPNRKHGTIIMKNHVKNPPVDRAQTQMYNADGQLLGWIWPELAERVLNQEWCFLVGSCSPNGPRAVIIPRLVDQDAAAMRELRYIESWRTAEAVIIRDALRSKITTVINTANSWKDIEKRVDTLLQQHLGVSERELVLSDIRLIRKKVAALELAIANDMTAVRHKLVNKASCRQNQERES